MKKKWLAVLVAALCMLAGSALAADFGVVYNTDNLNLRAQGSSTSEWLGTYPRGTWVEMIGSQNNFYRVRLSDGRTGYMSKNYVRIPQDRHGNIVVVSNPTATGFLNMREYPSTSARVVDIYYNDVPCVVLGYNNGWYCVEINGQIGYVSKSLSAVK